MVKSAINFDIYVGIIFNGSKVISWIWWEKPIFILNKTTGDLLVLRKVSNKMIIIWKMKRVAFTSIDVKTFFARNKEVRVLSSMQWSGFVAKNSLFRIYFKTRKTSFFWVCVWRGSVSNKRFIEETLGFLTVAVTNFRHAFNKGMDWEK